MGLLPKETNPYSVQHSLPRKLLSVIGRNALSNGRSDVPSLCFGVSNMAGSSSSYLLPVLWPISIATPFSPFPTICCWPHALTFYRGDHGHASLEKIALCLICLLDIIFCPCLYFLFFITGLSSWTMHLNSTFILILSLVPCWTFFKYIVYKICKHAALKRTCSCKMANNNSFAVQHYHCPDSLIPSK